MTQDQQAGMPDFDTWADDHIRRQYPFYTRDAALRVGDSLKRHLKEAWEAGNATKDAEIAKLQECVRDLADANNMRDPIAVRLALREACQKHADTIQSAQRAK